MHFAAPPQTQTGHLRALSTSWLARGDRLSAAILSGAQSSQQWYQLARIEVEAAEPRTLVAFGDSITDGSRSTLDGNDRWPDRLAERLQASRATAHWAVANQGLAGNRLLADGYGPSALARFDHDVLSQPHVQTVILLEGINDLGQFAATSPSSPARRAFTQQLLNAYQALVSKSRTRGLRIVGCTLLPFWGSDYHPNGLDEQGRQAVNDWIKAPGHFDAVIDWDAVMRDPGDPHRLKPEFDSGDHLHPSPQGYRAMADAIPVAELFP